MAPPSPPRRRQPATSKQDRLRVLELAAQGYYDSPKETLTRAAAYLDFVKRGPIVPRRGIKPGGKGK